MIKEIAGNQVVEQPPALFVLAHQAIKHNVKGGWRFLGFLQKTILRHKVAAYHLSGIRPVTVYAPLYRPESSKPHSAVEAYDGFIAEDIVRILNAAPAADDDSPRSIWMIDAGADIGMVSAQMLRRLPNLEQIFAFEPNDAARPYLEAMLKNSGVAYQVSNAAVGEHSATGRMVSPAEDASEHACYFEPCENGPVEMRAIDTLPSPTNKTVILKIDVEGGEAAVVRGANKFLLAADDFIVTFEAHPKVIKRTGRTPDEIWKLLRAIKPCRLTLAGKPNVVFTQDRSIRDQIPDFESEVHNLICTSITN